MWEIITVNAQTCTHFILLVLQNCLRVPNFVYPVPKLTKNAQPYTREAIKIFHNLVSNPLKMVC